MTNWRDNLERIAKAYGVDATGNWRNDLEAIRQAIEAGGGSGGGGTMDHNSLLNRDKVAQHPAAAILSGLAEDGSLVDDLMFLKGLIEEYVKTINNVAPDSSGNVQLLSGSITYLIEQGISVEEALDFILNTMVTQQQLLFKNMADNYQPTDIEAPMALFLDTDGNIKYHNLKQLGTPDPQQSFLRASYPQFINPESGEHEIEFDSDDTLGDCFERVGNALRIIKTDEPFMLAATIPASFNNVWLEYPLKVTLRLRKNGQDIGLNQVITITAQSGGVGRINDFPSELIPNLQAGDLFTLTIDVEDSSGFYGDGSWPTYSIGSSRSISAYRRNIKKLGYYYGINDIATDRLVISKRDNSVIPAGDPATTPFGLITYDAATLINTFTNIVFDGVTHSFLFTEDVRGCYMFLFSFPILKQGGGTQTGLVEFLMHIEYRADETAPWTEYVTTNDSRTFLMSSNGRASADYTAVIPFNNAGQYRLRTFWLDVASGNLIHDPQNRTVTLGGVIGGTAKADQQGKMTIIGMPIAASLSQ